MAADAKAVQHPRTEDTITADTEQTQTKSSKHKSRQNGRRRKGNAARKNGRHDNVNSRHMSRHKPEKQAQERHTQMMDSGRLPRSSRPFGTGVTEWSFSQVKVSLSVMTCTLSATGHAKGSTVVRQTDLCVCTGPCKSNNHHLSTCQTS
jgi:hypothetical protein